jgi:hypothetical protein
VADALAGVASDVGVAADSVVPCQQCGESKLNYPAGPQRVGGDADVVSDAFAGVTYDVGDAANSVGVLQGSAVKHAMLFARSTTGWWRC